MVPVGIARIDITPDYPIRLSGYGFRRAESEGVLQKIWAKALVIGDKEPTLLLVVDVCGLSHEFVEKFAKKLQQQHGIPRERFALTVTHTHTAPMVGGYLTTLFGMAVPEAHQKTIDRYTAELEQKLLTVAGEAVKERKPARLSWGMGSVGFARNRRPAALLTPSQWGSNPMRSLNETKPSAAPVDHDMPLLAVHDASGKLRAVWLNYACHCTTLAINRISGDWAGYAASQIETEHPGCTALISIGCGADSNPERADRQDNIEFAEKQGGFIANEARRMLLGFLAPLPGNVATNYSTFTLPLSKLPDEKQLRERAARNDAVGYQAKLSLDRLAKGNKLETEIPYSVQTWCFGNDLAMVFLPGEVVVDYALRLKTELHAQRLWVNAYANHVPCYIPSERILKEGGYEGGAAMTYYNLSSPLASGVEEKIISQVKDQLPGFKPPFDVNKLAGSKPLAPQQSASLIRVAPSLKVELVACEPLVTDPVTIAFGPDGKLWVAEMADYPSGLPDADGKTKTLSDFKQMQPGGRIKVLEDTNGDGKYDKATLFLDNIPFPTGITVWRNGVLICAAPDILYAEASSGSGKANIVKKLYSGFGTHNFQARVNSLEYGLDGWVHGSCGLFGGQIKSFNGKTYALGNRDFRIKPDTGELEPATGQTQQGRVRDDFDHWFGCDNTELAVHYPLPDHYLRRNAYLKPPSNRIFLPTGENANRLLTLKSQVQLFELSGPPGWPTAACGLGVYRDNLLGKDLSGNLFTCEAVNLLVHRLQLKAQSATFQGERASDEVNHEFLASGDNWFRPVQMRTGPDGCIWIVDMHRLVIEHPIWIPPADLAKLDLRAGSTMGRIYRVRPANGEIRSMPKLNQMNDVQLAEAMNTPNGTQRDLAMMQLLWKSTAKDAECLAKLLASPLPEVRVQALATMAQLKLLNAATLKQVIADSHPDVRKTAWRLAEGHQYLNDLVKTINWKADVLARESIPTLMQMAWAIGSNDDAGAGTILADILLTHPEDVYLQAAVLSALRPEHQSAFLNSITKAANKNLVSSAFMKQLAPVLVQGKDDRVANILQHLASPGEKGYANWQFQAVASLPLMQQTELPEKYHPLVKPMYAAARKAIGEEARSQEDRLAVMALLMGPGQTAEEYRAGQQSLLTLLGPTQTPLMQQNALLLLSRRLDDETISKLISSWLSYSPAIRSRLLDILLSRAAWQKILIEAIAAKQIPVNHLDTSSKQRLIRSTNSNIKSQAVQLFEGTSTDRASIIASYSQTTSKADTARGKALFTQHCSVCHQLGEQGHAVGPDLAALANRNASFLLQEILDPNKNLDSRYIEYVAVTKNGRTITGLLASEAGNSITLKGKEGRSETLLRSEIEELQASGKSLMPEGFEKEISRGAMHDLLAYLGSMRQNYKQLAGNTPAGTILANQSVHTLPAASAEIYGKAITFEYEYQNVGYWHDANDYVSWTVDIPTKGDYDIYFDWACANESAGNKYVLDIGSTSLQQEVAGTGGWSQYLRVRVAAGISLQSGVQRVKIRPAGPVKGALMDLRTVYIAPAEFRLSLPEGTAREKPDVAAIAKQILDDKRTERDRQALVEKHWNQAPELIVAMTVGMPDDIKEEYRRIPWIWRVAIFASKKNDPVILKRLMDVAMPQANGSLRDWQAVVIGGGVINGLGLIDLWPHEHVLKLVNTPELQTRWQRLLQASHEMADNEKVNTGTRYDALRIIALDKADKAIPRLKKYLPVGGNEEMQMGAVSGLVDVPTTEAAKLLADSLPYLKGENLELALIGMMRSPERFTLVLDQINAGKVKASAITAKLKTQLHKQSTSWPQALKERIARMP
jgi:putative membrane-bound dehydrogenase-like protein